MLTVVLTLVGAVAELVTIGTVLPVLAIAAKPDAMQFVPLVGPALAGCDRIYRLSGGRLIEHGSYAEIAAPRPRAVPGGAA